MDSSVLQRYLTEVINQYRFAVLSLEMLRKSLDLHDLDIPDDKSVDDYVFLYAHAFLTHVASISKLLWPEARTRQRRPLAEERSEELRSILNISEDSPINNRRLRNHFEHYDERLDEWASEERRYYIDRIIAPIGTISGFDDKDYMRRFDPTTFQLFFHGESFDLLEAEKEIMIIGRSALDTRREIDAFPKGMLHAVCPECEKVRWDTSLTCSYCGAPVFEEF